MFMSHGGLNLRPRPALACRLSTEWGVAMLFLVRANLLLYEVDTKSSNANSYCSLIVIKESIVKGTLRRKSKYIEKKIVHFKAIMRQPIKFSLVYLSK